MSNTEPATPTMHSLNPKPLTVHGTGGTPVQQTDNGLEILPMELRHVYALDTLPQVHNDPFDRLLIAQARAEQAHLVTADSQLKRYPVDILW